MEFDFAQNTKVTDINKIPSDFRGLYKQDGENFVLDAEHAGVKSAISAIGGLNTALKAARLEAKNKTAVAVDLTPLKDYGTTPDEIKTKIDETLDALKVQVKGVNVEKIKEDLAKEHSGKLTASEARAKALEAQLYSELVESRAGTAIVAEKGNAELLLPFVTKQVKTAVKDGKYQVNVVDAAGDIRFSGVTGAPMTINELVKELKTDKRFGQAFEGDSSAGGGGAGPGEASRKGAAEAAAASRRNAAGEGMSSTAKIAAGLKKGQHTKGN